MTNGLYPYSPFDKPVHVPTSEPNEGSLVCVMFADSWRPYVLGALASLLAKQTYAGTNEEIELATRRAGNLIKIFGGDECMFVQDVRIVDCVLQVQTGGDWVEVGSLSDCAPEPIFTTVTAHSIGAGSDATAEITEGILDFGIPQGEDGESGVPGSVGATGATGATGSKGDKGDAGEDGADGEDGATGATGATGMDGATGASGADGADGKDGTVANAPEPLETETGGERSEQACAISKGMAEYLTDKFISFVNIAKSAISAGKSAAKAAADVMDAIPLFGPVVSAIVDVITDMAAAGDFDDIIGFVGDPDFAQDLMCKLFCELDGKDSIGIEEITAAMVVARDWAIHLPLGLPLLTAYGPAFGLFLQSLDPATIYKRAYVHFDERSDDCVPCDCDPENFTHYFNFDDDDGGFVPRDAGEGSWVSGENGYWECGSLKRLVAERTMPSGGGNTTHVQFDYDYVAGTGAVSAIRLYNSAGDIVHAATAFGGVGVSTNFSGLNEHIAKIQFNLWCNDGAHSDGYVKLYRVIWEGIGGDPFDA